MRFPRAIEVLRSEGPVAFMRTAIGHLSDGKDSCCDPRFAELANRRRRAANFD